MVIYLKNDDATNFVEQRKYEDGNLNIEFTNQKSLNRERQQFEPNPIRL